MATLKTHTQVADWRQKETPTRVPTPRKTGRDGVFWTTRGADWGWKKYLNLSRCCMEVARLHGPGRDLLFLEIEVQVQGPFKLQVRALPAQRVFVLLAKPGIRAEEKIVAPK